jgi:hypothetical protein
LGTSCVSQECDRRINFAEAWRIFGREWLEANDNHVITISDDNYCLGFIWNRELDNYTLAAVKLLGMIWGILFTIVGMRLGSE